LITLITNDAYNDTDNKIQRFERVVFDTIILKNLTVKQFKDLGVLIGVYLDNAIEEVTNLEEKLMTGI